MREGPRIDSRVESVQNERGIIQRDGESFATIDGVHTVPVEKRLAENIETALRVQDKVDEALMAGHRPGFLDTVRVLNCRKTIFAVTEAAPLRSLTRTSALKEENLSRDMREEADGVPELKRDVERLVASGHAPVLGSNENMHIASYLDEHQAQLPAIVHVFEIPEKYHNAIIARYMNSGGSLAAADIMKMNRCHTFIVLGKDEKGDYACFHKQGPQEYHRFELQELDTLLALSVAPEDDKAYLSVIGPVPTEGALGHDAT